jgi:hypothetical protein
MKKINFESHPEPKTTGAVCVSCESRDRNFCRARQRQRLCIYTPRGCTCSNRRRQMAVSQRKKNGIALSACRRRRHTKVPRERDGREKRAPVASCCFAETERFAFCKWDRQTQLMIFRVSAKEVRVSLSAAKAPQGGTHPPPLPLHPSVGCHSSVCALKTQLTVACSPAGKSN